jgi:hypothetical protein
MTELQPSSADPEVVAFLGSIDRRLADLAGVAATCPFEPMSVANTFIAMMQHPANIVQVCRAYAGAMISVEHGARKAWERINAEAEAVSWPYGLAGVQKMAAEINRKEGMMPCPK